MKKLFISTFAAIVLVLSFGVILVHATPVTTPVNGYAWSSTIGWMQFDTGQASPVSVNTSTGNMTGYAWSSNIGWVDFGGANVNLATGAVTGWAQALSADGNGWDGKIELSGTNHTSPDISGNGGVTMITSSGAFVGYAWGGPVVGWLQFNGSGGPGAPGVNCPGCSGGGAAPVITGSCSAITPNTNLAPNTPVTFQLTPSSGTGPYAYSWSGQASTSANTFTTSYPSSVPSGPVVRLGDSELPVKGYSNPIICPGVSVIQPLGASNLQIGQGSDPAAATANSISINQDSNKPFILAWNIKLPTGYSCSASIANDPNIANWNTGWKSVVLNGSNGTDNGDGTMTWNSNTGANLSVPSSGTSVGSYQFKLTCTGGAMGTQTTSATLRITSSSLQETN